MTVRCKFTCVSRREYRGWANGKADVPMFEYLFTPVTGNSEENTRFWAATPAGSLQVSTVLEGQFEVGQTYYLDLLPARAA